MSSLVIITAAVVPWIVTVLSLMMWYVALRGGK